MTITELDLTRFWNRVRSATGGPVRPVAVGPL